MTTLTEGAPAPVADIAAPIVDVAPAAAPVADAPAPVDAPAVAEPAGSLLSSDGAPTPDASVAEPAAAPAPEPDPAPAGNLVVDPGAEPVADANAPADSAPAALPSYDAWTVPEGMVLQDDQISQYNELIGTLGLTQEAGQQLIDYGSEVLRNAQARMAEQQHTVYEELRGTWRQSFETEAGNRRETILNDAKSAIRSAVPDVKARQELWNVLSFTGAGDHPAVIKALAALGEKLREPGKPLPSLPGTPTTSAAQRRYAKRG